MSSGRLPRLAFDIDGVLASFQGLFLDSMNRVCGTSYEIKDWVKYDLAGNPFTKEQFDAAWKEVLVTPNAWRILEPCGDIDFYEINTEMGMAIYNGYFVTKRRDLEETDYNHGYKHMRDANYLTRMWLEDHGIKNYTSVISTASTVRVDMLKLIEADAYIDDWGEQFLKCRAAGINAYLIDRPYNQDIDTHYRVYSVEEFIDKALGRDLHYQAGASAQTVVGLST
jgi:uncharacterized HAD superfamily protein